MKSKSEMKRKLVQAWHACHECQLARGGKVPKTGFDAITVSRGRCPLCNKLNQTLVPNSDYNWPKSGQKAWFD